MRRQRKIHSLRRHYNEPDDGKRRSGPFGVHWAPETRPPSSISSASKRNSNHQPSSGWYKSVNLGHSRKPAKQPAKPKPATNERRNSTGVESAKTLSRQPTGLCPRCFDLALHHFQNDRVKRQHHRNFIDLVNSAKTCVLCFIIAKQAPIPPPGANFSYDGTRHITLSITNRQAELEYGSPGLALDRLMVYLPTTRLSDQRALTLPAQANLIAGRESQAATKGDVVGRRTYGGTNIQCAVDWLAECVMTHRECRKSTDLIGSLMYAVPPRLLDLGFNDSYAVRLIETDHNFVGPYVALTYTRGTSKVFSTNETNLSSRQQSIGIEKFNKTFKQAISITRMLGFRYLWIDAYCIVMDSPEDRTKHVPRMGIIFHNAALTLSAAVSPSADDGLVRFKAKPLTEAKIPYRAKDGTPLGHFFITSDKPRNFAEDVTGGELNQRAWCLQARALSRRTLHFGNDQLCWECDAGVWSEDSAIKCPSRTIQDPMVEWRSNFLKHKRGVEPVAQLPASQVKGRPTSAMLVIPKIYQLWYGLVAQYTDRNLPREKDKSSGIAGLAYIFACLISQRQGITGPTKPRPDTYLCGLWQNDLPYGLIWSSGSFHKWRMKFAKYPPTPRAPSWSWLSVDGSLHWPDGVVFSSGSFTSRSFMKLLHVGTHYDRRTDHEFTTLRVKGKMALLSNLYGFRPEDVDWKKAARDHDLAKHGGDHDRAEGPINMPCALFDSAEVARVWTTLHGQTIDRPSTGSSSTPSARSPGVFGKTHRSSTWSRSSASAKAQVVHDQQKDFVALLIMPAGCTQEDCKEHSFDTSRLSATLPLPADTAFRAKNNCGQGLAYALILYPSSMGEGLFRRVGIAQVRIADFATVERRRDREIVIV